MILSWHRNHFTIGSLKAGLTVLLLLVATQAGAVWPMSAGGGEDDEVVAMENGTTGDTYVVGHFRGSIQLGDTTLISQGGQDIFVTRISAGGIVQWAESAGGPFDDHAHDMTLDNAESIIIAGQFYDEATVGGANLTASGEYDGFAAKIDNQGAWKWAESMGGSGVDSATSVVAVPGDNSQAPPVPESVVVGGRYECRADFGPDITLDNGNCAIGSSDLFLARLESSDGEYMWASDRGSDATGSESIKHLEIDDNNRIYAVGRRADSGTQTLLSQNFGSWGSWSTSDSSFGALFYSSGFAFAGLFPEYYSFFNGSRVLALRGQPVSVYSPTLDTSSAGRLNFTGEFLRGFVPSNSSLDDFISDYPESGEDLVVEYKNSGGGWTNFHTFSGGGPARQRFDFSGRDSLVITNADAFHEDFQIRVRLTDAAGFYPGDFGQTGYYDWWYADNIGLESVGKQVPFLMTIGNVFEEDGPELGDGDDLPDTLDIKDLALDDAGSRLLMTGDYFSDFTFASCASVTGSGLYIASVDIATSNINCVWAKTVGNASAGAIAVDSAGKVFATGRFSNTADFYQDSGGLGTLTSAGGDDVYILSLEPDGQWEWVTGGDRYDEATGIPAYAGGGEDDAGQAIATNGIGTVFVGGRFRAVADFGPTDTLASFGGSDAFLINLGTDGRFFQEEAWTAGIPLTPPPDAKVDDVTFAPEFAINGQPIDALEEKIFYWAPPISGSDARLIPLQPVGSIEVKWRVQGTELQDPARISSFGAIAWPKEPCTDEVTQACYQVHITGAPVEAEPPSGSYSILEVIDPQSGSSAPEYSAGSFTTSRAGSAPIIYVNGPQVDPTQYPVVVEIVRSLPYSAAPEYIDGVEVEIGRRITDPFHNEPARTGWVVNELAYYDGAGSDAAYNRGGRTGSIIPVNRYSNSRPQEQGRELVVAWYRDNPKGVYWPAKAVRYIPRWPFDPERIVVASEQGSEILGQAPLSGQQFPSARVYVQNEFNLPGYNPNDEHAFTAPSNTGSGEPAVFALRSDFGSAIENDRGAASDPYVLVKYYNEDLLEWQFRVFRVDATGAGFNEFRYSGTVATTVSPPYPVSLLPGCSETFVEGQPVGGQPPPPFFQDYSNQLWSKSAGTGSVHYYYPAQPNFFVDLDNNDDNDIAAASCVPWLERLPEAEGGSDSPLDPIKVTYEIAWPSDIPLLTNGETLLSPKRGLPDIINQAAVEVVYDQHQESIPDALPSDTLTQLIDPLNPRIVYLDAMPAEIATEFQADGSEAILGSADGKIKLPVSIRDRISYDPLNGRLILTGIFDESGAGEPFLLLNVLSKRDRVTLKTLDGGDGSESTAFNSTCLAPGSDCDWDEAVEALFRESRNPQRIESICLETRLDENRNLICEQDRAVTADDVLIGYQDDGSDGILEPFQAVGVSAALTAGLSQGTGYTTVAFNNNQALSPLPVSLEVIEVGCLRSPPPPEPAEIFAPYQGQINVIAPENIFDEQLVLRHSGDFGGNPDALEFQWFYHPDEDGTPPMPVPDPESGQLNGWIQFPVDDPQGAVEISIEGANIQTLSDNWYLARYRGLPVCENQSEWSLYAGSPGSTPLDQIAQLAQGWVKRVLARLNPFEARVQDFAKAATNNYVSMLIQLGERYEGPVALNNDPDNLNQLGLIEAYTTVMRRAMQLSVDGTPPVNYPPANNAILLVASRLVDFYTLLGNEAYADAQDPTIGITTSDSDVLSLAPSIFNFQNQLASLLEEELVLLRGRDKSQGPVTANPVYNRLFWNFTTGDGEVAYSQSYNVSDQNADGVIDEFDARIMFPQGHGDAWGHYLTSLKTYYQLLKHPFFTWEPRPEAVTVAGVPIQVDFLDERQFAESAAAKARTGAEIVDLTYRSRYVENPDGQWQGYEDTDPERGWGLSEWGRRAGMGAYYDWATANSILPDEDPDPAHVGIQRIDRTTVRELSEITSYYQDIQGQVDEADAGLNPLGLAPNVVSFDIDPSRLEIWGETHYEQIANRAMSALENAVQVWDFANKLENQIRRTQNEADDLTVHSAGQETDFSNQLIEIFGYPYVDDIGPNGTYPAGYDGPDMYHYMYIDVPALAGTDFDFDSGIDNLGIKKINEFTGTYSPVPNGVNFFDMTPSPSNVTHTGDDGQDCGSHPISSGCALGEVDLDNTLDVQYTTIESPDFGFWFTKPEDWTGERRAPGKLQQILQQMLQARIALKQALLEYDKLRQEIEAEIDTLQATFDITEDNLNIAIGQRQELLNLTIAVEMMRNSAIVARRVGEFVGTSFSKSSECIPENTIAGLAGGGDLFSTVSCAVETTGNVAKFTLDTVADGLDIASNATGAAKEDVAQLAGINTAINDASLDLFNAKGQIDALMRKEPILRSEIFSRTEAIKQLVGDYKATLARGLRTFERLVAFRKRGAAAVQEYRYQDMAYRIFRNDALQKYRAAFDMAARYVYLAAAAYDYETNLLGSDGQAGQEFLTNIVRERSLGQILDGDPVPGTPGLADSLGQLNLNFEVLKGQMGFNNPQIETNRFSLRSELFRIPESSEGDAEWRLALENARVDNLWTVPEFRRYARPFAPESAGPQPGLVIPFTTNVTFGMNFFGWELGAGDSSYDSSQFATRIHATGSWFGDYANLPLADDPRIYLFPVGADVLRAPAANDFTVREWQVVDQAIPVPYPIGGQELGEHDWQPITDTVAESPIDIRRYARIPAYHFSEPFDPEQVISDSRLVGRSVWNRRWLMIIPGGTFLNDPVEGLDTFIHGEEIPGSGGEHDGNGISDIRIFFETYAYPGN